MTMRGEHGSGRARLTSAAAAVTVTLALLAGCSSPLLGGPTASPTSSSASPSAPPSPSETTAASTPETPGPPSDQTPDQAPHPLDSLSPELQEALTLLNSERSAVGARELAPAETLAAMATAQVDSLTGDTADWSGDFGEQLASTGFAAGVASVQINASVTAAIQAALDAADMRAQLLDPTFSGAGLASRTLENGQSALVIVLGYRADDGSLPAQSDGAQEALDLTNIERAEFGLPPLTLSEDLNRAAQGQADHQAAILEMTHEGNGGLGSRLDAVGYQAGAENVAVGQRSVAQVVQGWIDSPGHHANIVHESMTEMGFAVSFGSDGRAYFAQVFGDR